MTVLRCLNRYIGRCLSAAGLGTLLLGGCVEAERSGWIASSKTSAGSLGALFQDIGRTDPALERAPEIFRASGIARWDGRSTARGIWVAHPEAHVSRRVRIVNTRTGAEVDGMLYRPGKTAPGDAVTVSSDTAKALGLTADQPTLVSIFGVQSVSQASRTRRAAPEPLYGQSAEATARSELANHLARMSPNQTLQLAAAAMRGMGYATVFESATATGALPEIRAFVTGDGGPALSAIRVIVRASDQPPAGPGDLATLQGQLKASGDVGVLISIPGYTEDAPAGLTRGAGHLELLDLDGLLGIWVTHYETLSDPDRSLLRLQPVYFLAGG